MAVRPILLYPDPILKQVAESVEELDETVVEVVQDLVDTMIDAGHSVGVAAPQIGVLRRVVVVDVSKSKLGKEKITVCLKWSTRRSSKNQVAR